jgi:hypothetical protein
VNNGGIPPPTEAPGGMAGTGIGAASFLQLARGAPPPPATAEAHSKAPGVSPGVPAAAPGGGPVPAIASLGLLRSGSLGGRGLVRTASP